MIRARTVARAALLALLLSGAARADTPPNAWDVAKDPKARERWELHAYVSQILDARQPSQLHMRDVALEHARALLESAKAAESPDVRLRFDLGLVYERLVPHRDREAIEVLEPALAMAPNDTAAPDALMSLALAHARLDHPREERAAYKRFLALVTSAPYRATATLNLAEAEMRLGNLPDAVAGYNDAVQIAAQVPGGSVSGMLAVWGLAVALDRSGDPVAAARETKLAVSMDPEERVIGDESANSIVFFEPRYERFWYTALGAQEEARAASDARKAVRSWRLAVQRWTGYVTAAEHADGKGLPNWLPLARAHLESAKKELAAAEKRAKKAPPRPPALIDVEEP
jgi:tetratricopeptide (TPR) repeat protein